MHRYTRIKASAGMDIINLEISSLNRPCDSDVTHPISDSSFVGLDFDL